MMEPTRFLQVHHAPRRPGTFQDASLHYIVLYLTAFFVSFLSTTKRRWSDRESNSNDRKGKRSRLLDTGKSSFKSFQYKRSSPKNVPHIPTDCDTTSELSCGLVPSFVTPTVPSTCGDSRSGSEGKKGHLDNESAWDLLYDR